MRFALDVIRVLRVAALLVAPSSYAAAQDARPIEQAPASTPSDARPGFLDGLGKLLKTPADLLPSFSTSEPPPLGAEPRPNAVAAPPPLAAPKVPPSEPQQDTTRLMPAMVSGRERCPRGANGAPDCQTGSDRLCQSKGYKSGKSLNTDSAFSCSARIARAEGGKPCGNEHFVTSAFCN